MAELNKEIVSAIKDLDSENNMKEFLEKILEYELDQSVNENKDSIKTKGSKYKKFITDFSKWGELWLSNL